MHTPELFETIAHNGDGIDELPHPEVPYYVVAKEGYFLHRATQIGNVLLRETAQPKTLGRVGFANGVFTWKGDKIPGPIISQAHDFFRRTYEKHHAEAEVLITMHNETKQFRLFVPFQRVSHGGVRSVYEPTHIDKDYTVVGTLHSHCDFGAFHSSTDSGDASDMDGVHFTIGHVNQKTPQIVAMVAMAGKEFHYSKPDDIADIEYGTTTAPPWWDQYVFPASVASEKPKSLKSLTQTQWDEFRGIVAAKTHTAPQKTTGYQRPNGWVSPYASKPAPYTVPLTKREKKQIAKAEKRLHRPLDDNQLRWMMGDGINADWRQSVYGMGPQWGPEGELITGNPDIDKITQVLDFAEDNKTLQDEDWRSIKASDLDEIDFWKTFFSKRMADVAQTLHQLGMNVNFTISEEGETKP